MTASRSLALALPLALALGGCSAAPAPGPPPPMPVVTATVQRRDVSLASEWVATLDGYVNANIQPQVTGYLVKQEYREGQPVKKDEVMFDIDPRPFQAALDQANGQLAQARGQVAQAQAQVAQAQANLEANRLNVERDTPEAAAHAIAQSQLQNDTQGQLAAQAQVTAAEAAVTAQQAAVAAAQAQVEQASLNLSFTHVRALIDGVAGIAQVQIGNLVTPQTVLTAVSQLDPIKAYFPVSAQDYLRIASRAPGAVNLLDPQGPPRLQLLLADGSTFPHPGRVLFADRQVDATTGTLRLAAEFPNPGNLLRPGQYGRVHANTEVIRGALLVPQSAVTELQGAYQVALVGPGNKVEIRTIQVGPTSGSDWIVTQGLQLGDTVIAQGTTKVRNGARVAPQPPPPASPSPTANASPRPANPAAPATGNWQLATGNWFPLATGNSFPGAR